MPAPTARREFAKGLIDLAIRKAIAATGRKPRRAFAHLLWNVQARSELLRPARSVGRIEADRAARLVLGLLALVEHRKDWLRPVESWAPQGSGPLPLFSSLAHHLLADYPVPPVLLSAWFRGTDWPARRRQGWFKHAGLGKSLRAAGFPIRLSKRMAHEFARTPAHFPIEFALRWAQVRGLGGPDELARAVAATRLGREFHHVEFWVSVIHLFINTPRLDPAHVEPVVEYLHDQKFEPRRVIIGVDTEVELDPPQPDLSIKGRTFASFLRQAAEWNARWRPDRPERRLIRWDRSSIGGYLREGEEGRAWTVRELLDSDELAAEGKAMRHCVASYTDWCVKRLTTIWSVAVEGPEGRERLVTVEVNSETKEVVQAKAKCNEEPDEVSRAILVEWAGREGLKVEC
jgi:hypothetical protein